MLDSDLKRLAHYNLVYTTRSEFRNRKTTYKIMSRSLPALEICTRSGGTSDNGTGRGQGILWKLMDGRTVKEDTVGCGKHFVVEWISCTTRMSDEGPNSISSCTGNEGAKSPSEGTRGGGSRRRDSLECNRMRWGVPNDGRVRDSETEDTVAGGLEGKIKSWDAASHEIGSALALVR